MKKILYLFCAAAIVFAACGKEETPDNTGNGDNTGGNGGNTEYPNPTPNTAYTLQGGMDGTVWEEGATLGLYLSAAQNLQCTMDASSAGQETGKFTTPAITLNKGVNNLFVYSPYSEELVYFSGTIYGLKIDESQIQTRPNVMPKGFSYGTATGVPGSNEPFTFELTSVSAIAKVNISTTALAGYAVESISLSDADNSIDFGGQFSINTTTTEVTPAETFKKAGVVVANKEPLASGTVQSFYIQLLPGDYSTKTLYFTVRLVKEGALALTLPMSQSGLKFEAGKVTEINLTDISNESAAEWFVTEDSRIFPGLGYAYGEANTFLIQCKSGSTYTGATYAENASIPDEVSIDIRPRGDISKVVDPKGATFEWYKSGSGVDKDPYVCRTSGYESSAVDPTKYTISYDGNYTVKVKNTGAYAGSPILLMKKGGKVLWAWTFWNIAADGTELKEIPVGNFKLANMEIGQATTQFETWVANKAGSNPDMIARTVHFYQFGRPVPTFWTTYWSLVWPQQTAGNLPAIEGPVTLEYAIENPVGQILNPAEKQAGLGNWCTETVQNIWGGSTEGDNDYVGTKTVYDPCPKGWKVPHPGVLNTLAESTATVKDLSGAVGVEFSAAAGTRFVAHGYGNGKTGNTSDWRLATMGGGATGAKGANGFAILWSNMGGATSGTCLQFHTNGTANKLTPMDRANAGPVRCMKDPDAM